MENHPFRMEKNEEIVWYGDVRNALVHDEGILKTLFKAVKASTSSTMFDRVFITGVSPVVLSDIISGLILTPGLTGCDSSRGDRKHPAPIAMPR